MKTYEAFLISLPSAEAMALARTKRNRIKLLRAAMRWAVILIFALAFITLWRGTPF